MLWMKKLLESNLTLSKWFFSYLHLPCFVEQENMIINYNIFVISGNGRFIKKSHYKAECNWNVDQGDHRYGKKLHLYIFILMKIMVFN